MRRNRAPRGQAPSAKCAINTHVTDQVQPGRSPTDVLCLVDKLAKEQFWNVGRGDFFLVFRRRSGPAVYIATGVQLRSSLSWLRPATRTSCSAPHIFVAITWHRCMVTTWFDLHPHRFMHGDVARKDIAFLLPIVKAKRVTISYKCTKMFI